MSTTTHSPKKDSGTTGTDPRPRNIFLGIDAEGSHHVFQTRRHRVVVVEGTEIVHVQDLGGKIVEDWMEFVEERRGFKEKRYGVSIVEMLTEPFEGGDD